MFAHMLLKSGTRTGRASSPGCCGLGLHDGEDRAWGQGARPCREGTALLDQGGGCGLQPISHTLLGYCHIRTWRCDNFSGWRLRLTVDPDMPVPDGDHRTGNTRSSRDHRRPRRIKEESHAE
jgi:hypothetical protein